MENETQFRVRCYTKSELARLYTPWVERKSAARNLRRWILRNQELSAALDRLGYRPADRILSAAQVREIVRFLGEP